MRKTILLSIASFAMMSQSFAQRWHIKPTADEIAYRKAHPKNYSLSMNKPTASTYTMPSDVRIPAEFEESQAVAIAWVSDGSGPDVTSEYGDLWGDMADAIQKECPVWIRIENAADSNTIKTFMSGRGTPLTNYRFFVTVADDFWVRDFGPIGFYYGSNDDLGILDMNYYDGRNNDDLFPEYLAGQMGITCVKTNLYAEGGNFITDGFNRSFHSSMIYSENNGSWPQPKHGTWSQQQIIDTMKYVWASPSVISTQTLKCDGGTGHNDMFMKLMDEQTFAIMEYPSVVTAGDKAIINNVINTLSATNTVYGKPYRIFKLPMPTQDNGSYLTSCSQIDGDARTFVNGLTVNKTYLMPSYSNASSGNKSGDSAAIEIFKKNAPGYKIVPLDSRILTVLGGAIHCVTMQIPADNPVTIWHPPIVDEQPLKSSYHIVAEITNRSGISSATCYWRKRGTSGAWNIVLLTDSAGYKIGDISGTFSYMEGVEYYISATTNNGKTMTKPIVASSGGYYTFFFPFPAGVQQLDPTRNFALNALPNPNTGSFVIPVSFDREMKVQANVTDILGRKISTVDFGTKPSGMSKLEFELGNQPQGMYYVQILVNGQVLDTKRVMIE